MTVFNVREGSFIALSLPEFMLEREGFKFPKFVFKQKQTIFEALPFENIPRRCDLCLASQKVRVRGRSNVLIERRFKK